jgi:hypothetical protein
MLLNRHDNFYIFCRCRKDMDRFSQSSDQHVFVEPAEHSFVVLFVAHLMRKQVLYLQQIRLLPQNRVSAPYLLAAWGDVLFA